jgi:pSer/pThr/pTyr-binding forkhead associated (FHA) protein
MLAFLEVVSGAKVGQRILIKEGNCVLGRSKEAIIRIPSSRVSRKHCVFIWRKNQLFVEDQGSMNGTLVNGVAIQKQTLLREGDNLSVGPVVFKIVIPTSVVEPIRGPSSSKPVPPSDSDILSVLEPKTMEDIDVESGDDIFALQDDESQNTVKPKPRRNKTQVGSNEFKEVNGDVIPPLPDDEDLSLKLGDGKDLRDILSQLESLEED